MKTIPPALNHFNSKKDCEKASFSLPEEAYFLQKVKQVIKDNISNSQFDISMLAQSVDLSISQLNRRLKSIMDCPPGLLIRKMRMEYATFLLLNNVASIGEIATEIGYNNTANFCRSFKQYFGCSPSKYIKNQHFMNDENAKK